ncbi:MAG: pyridoxal 5'-phosphate synthase, partial [Acidobacteriota bacterium]
MSDIPYREPFEEFERWYAEARQKEPRDANAMTLATATSDGIPAARLVLLKGVDERGYVFFTNFESRKGVELLGNPRAALCFHWKSLLRQVRIEGGVERVSDAEADAYFATRPRDSQIGAWASDQSRPVASRE